MSICRELIRLPRGNREAVLEAVCHHRLTYRETRLLVDTLIARPEQEHPAILAEPRRLDTGTKAAGYSQPVMPTFRTLIKGLEKIAQRAKKNSDIKEKKPL